MGKLNPKDMEIVQKLRKAGVLKDVDPSQIKTAKDKGGEIVIMCSDGDQFAEMYSHRIRKTGSIRPEKHRPHMIALAGGPLLISPNSPIHNPIIIQQIDGAIQLKGIKNIALYGHVPCGAPSLVEAELSVYNMIRLLMEGEDEIKNAFGDVEVKRYFHVDNHGKKRTYFISREKWEEVNA